MEFISNRGLLLYKVTCQKKKKITTFSELKFHSNYAHMSCLYITLCACKSTVKMTPMTDEVSSL